MIRRDLVTAPCAEYDLIVVGGGVQGIALALEAARRGMRPLVIERDDFGSRTSWNSLRIVHGGLRYLQTLDIPRFRESVRERRWFLANFPELAHPLSCLMPLYGEGLHRPSVLKAALAINDVLSLDRNRGVRADRAVPESSVLSPAATLERCPDVRRNGLCGAALWHDVVMPQPQRVLMTMLNWAVERGATALNYVEARRLLVKMGQVTGVEARDQTTGDLLEFRARTVVLCAGPWNASLAARFCSGAMSTPPMLLAFNAFLKQKPRFDVAVAVSPQRRGSRTYFLHPVEGGVLAGTFHAAWSGGPDARSPSPDLVRVFLADLRSAIPGFDVGYEDVLRVHWGLLPAKRAGTDVLTKRPDILRCGDRRGPSGLYSISGIKFTTARSVAERALRMIHTDLKRPVPERDRSRPATVSLPPTGEAFRKLLHEDPDRVRAMARQLAETEAVVHLDDLIMRRTDWGQHPRDVHDVEDVLKRDLALSRLPAAANPEIGGGA